MRIELRVIIDADLQYVGTAIEASRKLLNLKHQKAIFISQPNESSNTTAKNPKKIEKEQLQVLIQQLSDFKKLKNMKKTIIIAASALVLSAGVVLASQVKTETKSPVNQTIQVEKLSVSMDRKDIATAD